MSISTPTSSPSDDAARARIITHMNTDHAFSLLLFSRHYSHLPLSHAKTSVLDSITLEHMIITSSFGRCLIPFTPPLTSYAEVRERVVSMHHEALRQLDVYDVMVTRYVAPDRIWMWVLGTLTTVTMITLAPPFWPYLHPDTGSWVSKVWTFGGLARWNGVLAWKLAPVMWPVTIAIHVGEAVYMAMGRLRRGQVETGGGLWWAWVVDNFLEGFGAWNRFDEEVERVRVGKKGEKVNLSGKEREKGKGGH
jgi:hypothetical protein